MKKLLICFLIVSCGKKATDQQHKWVSYDVSQYQTLKDSLTHSIRERFNLDGWIVSRQNGEPYHLGDSAKYTGIAMAVLPCAQARVSVDAVIENIIAKEGFISRFKDETGSSRGETSRDAVTGVLFGLGVYSLRCGKDDRIGAALKLHYDYVIGNDEHLDKGDDKLTPGMRFFWASVIGIYHNVDKKSSYDQFKANLLVNGLAALKFQSECYPVDISMLQYLMLKKLGHTPKIADLLLACLNLKPLHLAHVDYICSKDPRKFLDEWKPNEYEYKLQFCPWQDGKESAGFESHGLDYLLMEWLARGAP